MALHKGWVRITPKPDSCSKQIIAVAPDGSWGTPTYMASAVTAWSFDEDTQADTLIALVNRLNSPINEIEVENWWHEQNGTTIVRKTDEFYYTELMLLSAKECVTAALAPPSEPEGEWPTP